MINAQFKLIILVLDASTNTYKIVSSTKDCFEYPFLNIESNLDINSCLDHILTAMIQKNESYHNFKLTDIVLSEMLEIYYIVFITYETTIKSGHLFDIQPSLPGLPNNAKKIISLL